MGLLNRMIEILCHITPDENIYEMKLAIIENCIYGSDIQSIAAQITKLRFFISLICNCEKDATKPNFGIPTLPNLETKFVAANSLIAKKKQVSHNLFENPEIEPTKKELTEIRHEHFSAKTAYRKSTLREKDKQLREKLAKLLAEDNDFAPEDAKQLAAWNPYDQNAVAEFFDHAWMFGVNDGFDIVIGNPPILRGRDIKRYGYNWANLWLINTHNGIRGKLERVHIEDYPAIKAHLDQYWDRISKRADKGDTPYNLRNCAYLEDFSKPKILWKRVGSILRFCYNDNEALGLDSTCFAIGNNIEFVCCVLNTPMGHYLLKDAPKTGTGDLLISVQAVEPLKMPSVSHELNKEFKRLLEIMSTNSSNDIENEISQKIFNLYGLSCEEQRYIDENFT